MYAMQYNNNTKAVDGVCVLITPAKRNFKTPSSECKHMMLLLIVSIYDVVTYWKRLD